MPSTFESLIVLIAFVLPGYISVKFRSSLRTGRKLDSVELALEFLFFATANALVGLLLTYLFAKSGLVNAPTIADTYKTHLESQSKGLLLSNEVVELKLLSENRGAWMLWRLLLNNITPSVVLIIIVIGTSIGLGAAAGKWTGKLCLFGRTWSFPINPYPTVWDQYFLHTPDCIVYIRRADGTSVAGLFHRRSFASLSPGRELFLEKEIAIASDGQLIGQMENSSGVLVDLRDAQEVRFYPLSALYEENHDRQENQTA